MTQYATKHLTNTSCSENAASEELRPRPEQDFFLDEDAESGLASMNHNWENTGQGWPPTRRWGLGHTHAVASWNMTGISQRLEIVPPCTQYGIDFTVSCVD